MLNIARIYHHKNSHHRALEKYREALRMQRHAKGINQLDLASTLEDIGLVNSRLGKIKPSINAYLEALAIKTKILGKRHYDVSTLMNSIGLAYFQKARYDDALYYFGQCLSIRSHDRPLGSGSISSVKVRMNMATVHMEQENYNKALELFGTCLRILESCESDEDRRTDVHNHTISTLYEGMIQVYEKMDCPMNASYIREEAKKLRRTSMRTSAKEAKRKSPRGVSPTNSSSTSGSASSSSSASSSGSRCTKYSRSRYHDEEKRGSMSMGVKEANRKPHYPRRGTASSTCTSSSNSTHVHTNILKEGRKHRSARNMRVHHHGAKKSSRRATMDTTISSVCATIEPDRNAMDTTISSVCATIEPDRNAMDTSISSVCATVEPERNAMCATVKPKRNARFKSRRSSV